MDYYKRSRRRRGRCGYGIAPSSVTASTTNTPPSSSGIGSYLIMTSLIAIIYLLLEYNCNTCGAKSDLKNITMHVENIVNNLKGMKESYRDLEQRVERFSLEFPKFEGQLSILEVLANTLQTRDLEWDPHNHLPLHNVDVTLNSRKGNETNNLKTGKQDLNSVNGTKLEGKPH